MSKEQIEEMAKALCGNGMSNGNCAMDDEPCNLECVYGCCAEKLYAKGYRKQSEGEWVSNCQSDEYICSLCGGISPVDCEKENFYKSNYCPNCGAKMKGGVEE